MEQMARNLVDAIDGFLLGKRYLLLDRDPLYTQAFRRILDQAGVKTVRLPAHSPNLNAFAERFVLSIKSECLERLVPLGESHLRLAIAEYMRHYHLERNHQGLANALIYGSTQAWPETAQSLVGKDSADYSSSTIGKLHEWLRRSIGTRRRLTFGLTVDQCPACGGRMKLRALVRDPESIERFLRHQGMWSPPTDPASARAPPYHRSVTRLAWTRQQELFPET
jgi:hypothetical protein